ncbi:MAG TPA: hypothetical protein VM821_05030, partial [Abditibacteriaceae bacterium]|nr:hypothetical protein [Abditibacteriaceae bacterium]
MIRPFVLSCAAFLITACILPAAVAQTTVAQTPASPPAQTLLDMSRDVAGQVVPSSPQVTVSRHVDAPKLVVTMTPGQDNYPGVRINPLQGSWDLSRFGHVEARVTNPHNKPLTLSLRVDNASNGQTEPWNTESITIAPQESRVLRTFFGYSYGAKPGYKLKPQAVVSVLLFASKSDEHQVFVIDSLKAAGFSGETPPIAPDAVRIKPRDGVLFVSDGTFDVINDRGFFNTNGVSGGA